MQIKARLRNERSPPWIGGDDRRRHHTQLFGRKSRHIAERMKEGVDRRVATTTDSRTAPQRSHDRAHQTKHGKDGKDDNDSDQKELHESPEVILCAVKQPVAVAPGYRSCR
jgi:hypothetical protein